MGLLCAKSANCLDLWQPETLAAVLGGLLGLIGTVLSVGIAAYLTYRYARKHSASQHNTEIRVEQLRRQIDALETIWELLAYMTDRESGCAIVRWRKGRDGSKTFYFDFENLKVFLLSKVSETFYTRHAGLHIPSAISAQLFEYHSILMGLYLRYADAPPGPGGPPIVIENPELIEKLQSAYRGLNAALREELASRYRLLSIDDE
jgi:hypothetical protein